MTDKLSTTALPIHDLLARRWSPRAFDPDRAISAADQTTLCEAARWAPSCFGEEPWRFVLCDRFADDGSWQRAFETLVEGNRAWAGRAPLLIVTLAHGAFAQSGRPNRWAQHDTGLASENLLLQATALGLVAHPMGGFDREEIASRFELPEELTPMAVIAVGHPGDPDLLDEKRRERELGPRRRQPLSERFFAGGLDRPFEPSSDR